MMSLGAAAGGAVLSMGMGYAAVSIMGAILTALGLVLVFIQMKIMRAPVQQVECL